MELTFPGFAGAFYAVYVLHYHASEIPFFPVNCMQFARNEQLSEKIIITWILNALIFAIDPGIIRRIFSVSDLETLLIRACLVKLLT